jgi:hypothetical protein
MSFYHIRATYNTSANSKSIASYTVRMQKTDNPDYCYSRQDGPTFNNISAWVCTTASFQGAMNRLLDYLNVLCSVDVMLKHIDGKPHAIFLSPVDVKHKNGLGETHHLLGRITPHGRWIANNGDELFAKE